jgi:NADPH:quinone reductase-like Zn-dependent oxidoreductase
MKAAVLHKLGQHPRYEEFSDPVPQPGEALLAVRAASLKAVDRQMASGSHYAHPKHLPVVCGIDGVGTLDNGSRVYFGGPRAPFGAMAERTVAPLAFCFPVPDALDDATAAALPNPGVSAHLVLSHRARLTPGESVLILGATGTTGRIAVQIAKLLGASRVVGAGRNPKTLAKLAELGADATIQLNLREPELVECFLREGGKDGFNIVVDFVWGRATELFLASVAQTEIAAVGPETRLIQVGESAAPTISLPAAVLRSRPVTIRGTAGIPPREALANAMNQVMDWAVAGQLRIDTETIPLSQVEQAWQRTDRSRRLVLIP